MAETFEDMLTGGHPNSLGRTVEVVELVLAEPDRFQELFENLMSDEEDHIDFLETQIDLYENLGEQHYGLLNASSANED